MKKFIFLSVACLLAVVSCDKDNSNNDNPEAWKPTSVLTSVEVGMQMGEMEMMMYRYSTTYTDGEPKVYILEGNLGEDEPEWMAQNTLNIVKTEVGYEYSEGGHTVLSCAVENGRIKSTFETNLDDEPVEVAWAYNTDGYLTSWGVGNGEVASLVSPAGYVDGKWNSLTGLRPFTYSSVKNNTQYDYGMIMDLCSPYNMTHSLVAPLCFLGIMGKVSPYLPNGYDLPEDELRSAAADTDPAIVDANGDGYPESIAVSMGGEATFIYKFTYEPIK